MSRQDFAQAPPGDATDVARGGYVLAEAWDGAPRAVVIATGSEIPLALQAQHKLQEQGVAVRVVSMPCTEAFDRQDADYRERVLPSTLPAVAVEAGHPETWWRYVGREGRVIGIAQFGESAPGPTLFAHFGVTVDAVVAAVRELLARD